MSDCSKDCGCGSNAGKDETPRETVLNPSTEPTTQTKLKVDGMDCADEVAAIKRALKPIRGIRDLKVSLMGGTATIAHDNTVTPRQLIIAVERTGLRASQISGRGESADEQGGAAHRSHLVPVIVSGTFTAISLLLQWQSLLPPYGKAGAALAAVIAGGWLIFPKAIRALRQASLDMNVLMSVAVIGAACIGEWTEAAAVVFLFALSELLEAFSVARARKAVQSLLELTPETALVQRNGQVQEVRVQEVGINEKIIIRSGARVPLDGVVVTGQSDINQAPITGESMPVNKKPGDAIFAGTINGEGSLEARV